jgi:hypothetical protein
MNSRKSVLTALKKEEMLASASILDPAILLKFIEAYIQAARSNN